MMLRVSGFMGAAVAAGIKYKDRLDLGLIVSRRPAALAGVFTTNEVKAAPVLAGIERLRTGRPHARALVVNSGNANACTGAAGLADVRETAGIVAGSLNVAAEDVLMCSTGVIGVPLPMDRIRRAVPGLVAALAGEGLEDVARAILTTDTVKKTALRRIDVGGPEPVTLAGMVKGAGMIGPRMGPPQATLLAFVLSDALVAPAWWQGALERSVADSFNRVVVDGDTSTNDTVLALANGSAGNAEIDEGRAGEACESALRDLLRDLALQLVKDGEGVTKCVRLLVRGARDFHEADSIARTVAGSPLVKTAFFGEDPNWGRILAAAGRAGFPLDQDAISVAVGGADIVRGGRGLGPQAEALAKKAMERAEFTVTLDLGLGDAEAGILTCDLSSDYVRINASYRT